MNAKCFIHLNTSATGICEQCGFLCGEDSKEHLSKKHNIININENFNQLYAAALNKQNITAQSATISLLKKKVNIFFEIELKHNATMKAKANDEIKKCILKEPKLANSNINKYIMSSIKINRIDSKLILEELANALKMIESKILAKPNNGKEIELKANQIINDLSKTSIPEISKSVDILKIKSNSEFKINEYYKKYQKNEKLGNCLMRKKYGNI